MCTCALAMSLRNLRLAMFGCCIHDARARLGAESGNGICDITLFSRQHPPCAFYSTTAVGANFVCTLMHLLLELKPASPQGCGVKCTIRVPILDQHASTCISS